jgi:hypothetical protein
VAINQLFRLTPFVLNWPGFHLPCTKPPELYRF